MTFLDTSNALFVVEIKGLSVMLFSQSQDLNLFSVALSEGKFTIILIQFQPVGFQLSYIAVLEMF